MSPTDASAYARLVLDDAPEEARVGLTLGFVRTFGVPAIAEVLAASGKMTERPKDRAKATGVAMFALIRHGTASPEGRRVVAALRQVHDRPGITPELMHYVLACFTVCSLRGAERYGPCPVTDAARESAYAFHRELAAALGLPEPPAPGGGLAGVERWMRAYEARHFAPSAEGAALWAATRRLLAARLPRRLAPLAPAVAATLLDDPLRAALGVRRPAVPVRALVLGGLRLRTAVRRYRWRASQRSSAS